MTAPTRILAIADSDSYLKWGAALLARAPEDWERSLVILASPVLPSPDQIDAALVGSSAPPPVILDLSALAVRIAALEPDVVLIAVRGPLVKVIVRAIVGAARRRPVIVSGLPGISIPATRMAIAHRAQADLVVLHSRREVRDFGELARRIQHDQRFALATLPFLVHAQLDAGQPGSGDLIFAAQAKVPPRREDRLLLLGWLVQAARNAPDRRVVVKVRAAAGEAQTHAEQHEYSALLSSMSDVPENLVVEGGAMAQHLSGAAGLVTVSSTAAIEAVALSVPVLALADFGVDAELINPVFEGSGLFGDAADLAAWRFHSPEREWLDDNYFHGVEQDDWVGAIEALLAIRESSVFPLKPLKHGLAGGRLRRAWDRKVALGRFDRSYAGLVALLVGVPARAVYHTIRRIGAAISPRPAELSEDLREAGELVAANEVGKGEAR
ncbi:hypothetical protein BH09ACT3_BH09ACT3_08530 [soil metagenome]